MNARRPCPLLPNHRGTRGDDVPPETQFLLLELGPDGPYAFIMPLICGTQAPDPLPSPLTRPPARRQTPIPLPFSSPRRRSLRLPALRPQTSLRAGAPRGCSGRF